MEKHQIDPFEFMIFDEKKDQYHQLELFKDDGQLFIQISIGGDVSNRVKGKITKDQLAELLQGLSDVSGTIRD